MWGAKIEKLKEEKSDEINELKKFHLLERDGFQQENITFKHTIDVIYVNKGTNPEKKAASFWTFSKKGGGVQGICGSLPDVPLIVRLTPNKQTYRRKLQ